MFHRVVAFCTLFLVPWISRGADLAPAPTQQLLRVDPAGNWELVTQVTVLQQETRERTVRKAVPVTEQVTETVDGKIVTKDVTRYQEVTEVQTYDVMFPEYRAMSFQVAPNAIKAFEIDGRLIPLDKLRSRVAKDTLVVVSSTSGMIPGTYAQLFKSGTIVLGKIPHESLQATPNPNAAIKPLEPPPGWPNSPAPYILTLQREGAENVVVNRVAEMSYTFPVMKEMIRGDRPVTVSVQMQQVNRVVDSVTFPGQHLTFAHGGTKEISFDRSKEKLSRETLVVYTTDGHDIAPFWLSNLKPTTIVVNGPQLPTANVSSPSVMPTAPGLMAKPATFPPPAVPVPAQ